MPHLQIPDKLYPFFEKKKRFKVAYGGRGAGKSQAFASLLLMRAQTEGIKILCLREMQNSISDSVHSLLETGIDALGLDGFETTQQAIRYNGEDAFKFRGMARNPDSVKSLHGFSVAWVEEAQACSEKSIRLLTPTLRETDSELWFSMNPGSSSDPMSQRFLKPFEKELRRDGYYEDDLHLIIKVNYPDNPWFPDELELERQWDKTNLSRSMYDHVWLGEYADDIENSLIAAEWFDSCIDAHKKLGFEPTGARYASHDPSDLGPDAKGYAMRHGSVVLAVESNDRGTVNEGCDWATGMAARQHVDHFIFDGDGMGVALRDQVARAFQGTHTNVTMFRGSESPDTPDAVYQATDKHVIVGTTLVRDAVKNKRAQYYAALRHRIHLTHQAVTDGAYADPDDLISFDSDIPELMLLRSELCRLPIKPNSTGKIELYTKPDMKRLFHMDSPNLSDCVSMLFCTPAAQKNVPVFAMPRAIRPMGARR